MTVSVHEAETSGPFGDRFQIHRRSPLASVRADVERIRPAVAFFDFDFPTKPGLNLLRETKRAFPSLPLIMLTVQHSEALAVWAFRSRVWDYLVKPLSRADLERCLASLGEMLVLREAQTHARTAAIPASSIPDEHRVSGRSNAMITLAPALTYVEQSFQSKISAGRAAELCGLSAFQFSRSFKEAYAVTFQEYVLRFRIREACRLLKNPDAQVADVAALVGFNDSSHFCKIFKRYTSISPSRFNSVADGPLLTERLLDAWQAE